MHLESRWMWLVIQGHFGHCFSKTLCGHTVLLFWRGFSHTMYSKKVFDSGHRV